MFRHIESTRHGTVDVVRILERRLVDEAPSAYRDIRAVMRAQRDLTAICRELKPLVSHKGF